MGFSRHHQALEDFPATRRVSPTLWALAGYGFTVIADILWAAPLAFGREPWDHEPWMDVFLGHVSLDHWPGTWYSMLPVTLAGAMAAWWLHRWRKGHELSNGRI